MHKQYIQVAGYRQVVERTARGGWVHTKGANSMAASELSCE